MTWLQLAPGIYKGVPAGEKDEELEMRAKLSNIPLATAATHRLSKWKHREKESWWDTISQYAGGSYQHPFVTFLGPVGTGKTHIAFALGWEWLEGGKTVLYYQVEVLLDALRRGYSSWKEGDPDGYAGIIAFTQHAGLLILDDFGAQNETEWAETKLDQIIDYRYEYRRPLIATTNLALNRFPPRIKDRLSEGLLVHLSGESFRKHRHRKE